MPCRVLVGFGATGKERLPGQADTPGSGRLHDGGDAGACQRNGLAPHHDAPGPERCEARMTWCPLLIAEA